MTLRSSLLTLTFLGFVVAGCAQGTPSGATSETDGVVKGAVAYRERVALPPDAVVEVWMMDVSPMIMIQALIAETTVRSEGRQVPIPFELRYDPGRIVADHDYGVKAVIKSAGEILFETPKAQPVITKGNPASVDLWLTRAALAPTEAGVEGGLRGTAWRLEDLGGVGVVDRVEATLEFLEDGKVVGRGSCNRFAGAVEISGQAMKFGPLASTKMACPEAVMNQEDRYLKALQDAERFEQDASKLRIYSKGMEQPLLFVRKEK
jgi:putative lipoprotein